MKRLRRIAIIAALAALASCEVFFPNFLVGTWIAPGTFGSDKIVFTKEALFTAEFYKADGSVEKISGTYSVGKAAVLLNFAGQRVYAGYTMEEESMSFLFRGITVRFLRAK